MTTIASAHPFDMEFLQPEDTMELASSPHMPQDDLDLDLDPMHEPEMAPEDTMLEDADDSEQLQASNHLDEDEMVDEDTASQHFPENVSDLDMEAQHDQETAFEDEDILYEDEDAPKDSGFAQPAIDSTNVKPGYNYLQELPSTNSGDVEVVEAHIEDVDAPIEQDSEEFVLNANPRIIKAGEEQHAVEDEHHQSAKADDTIHLPSDGNIEAHAYDQAHIDTTTGSGSDLQDSTTNTNPIDPIETAHEKYIVAQDTTDYINTIGEEAADEQYILPLEGQDLALHTVKVIYEDSEICLFPPQSGEGAETFFLPDESLAHEPLDKLLASCRDVLADSIGDDDELVLDVASLGLHISEGSKYAAKITLSQILDVFLTLSHNDNVEQIEPLYCTLTSRICLASQYAYLAAAAQQGKTITEITAEHMDSPEKEVFEEDKQEHLEETAGDHATQHKATQPSPQRPEEDEFEEANHNEEGAQETSNETTEDREDDPKLETTSSSDNLEASKDEELGRITDSGQTEQVEAVESWTRITEIASPNDQDIQPHDTEYQEDIDEFVNDDHGDPTQEAALTDEESFEALGTNDETASSGTVQAEANQQGDEHLEGTAEHDGSHPEAFADSNNHYPDTYNIQEAQNVQIMHPLENTTNGDDPLQLEEDLEDELLDLGPEDQESSSADQPKLVAEFEETGLQDVEDNEDLFADVDASTDRTLDNIQGDEGEGDALDAFDPSSTPAKTRNAKRKAEVDDEDEFDLLETETPDKKRGRPSY